MEKETVMLDKKTLLPYCRTAVKMEYLGLNCIVQLISVSNNAGTSHLYYPNMPPSGSRSPFPAATRIWSRLARLQPDHAHNWTPKQAREDRICFCKPTRGRVLSSQYDLEVFSASTVVASIFGDACRPQQNFRADPA